MKLKRAQIALAVSGPVLIVLSVGPAVPAIESSNIDLSNEAIADPVLPELTKGVLSE